MSKRSTLLISSALLATMWLLAAAIAPPVLADTILDDFQVNTNPPGHPPQDSPSSVANWQTQTIYTTFLSKRDGVNWDVALARHNYDLQPLGETTYLNVRAGTYNCKSPKLALSSQGVGAAWIEARQPNRIYFRSLDAQGNPLCLPVRVEDDFQNLQRDSLSIVTLSNGYLLVWFDYRDQSKIWAQKVDFNGNLVGINFAIQPDSTGTFIAPEAQNHPDGRVLVSWVAYNMYNRGRWFDSQGNFIGNVFDMSAPWLNDWIVNSAVRFNNTGTGILYQYSFIELPAPNGWEKYVYTTYLDNSGLQSGHPVHSDFWEAEFFYPGNLNCDYEHWVKTFPEIFALSDSDVVTVRNFYHTYGVNGYYGIDTECRLYSSVANSYYVLPYINAWGASQNYSLIQLDEEQLFFAFDWDFVGVRQYDIATLNGSNLITWIYEPNFSLPQDHSDICVHQNGDFRVTYNNYIIQGKEMRTRYYYTTGIPAAPDTQIANLSQSGNAHGLIDLTGDDQVLATWWYGWVVKSRLFEHNIWNGTINNFPTSPPISSYYDISINSENFVLLTWVYGDFDIPYFAAYSQLYNLIAPSQTIGPSYSSGLVSLRDDGRFLICTIYNGGWIYVQTGSNYTQLIGVPNATGYRSIYEACLDKSNECYWLAWNEYTYVDQTYIDMQAFDVDGNPLTENVRVSGTQPSVDRYDTGLDIAVTPSGRFAVVWQDLRNDEGDIYCRQYDPDYGFYGAEFRVNSDSIGKLQTEPAVSFGPDDRLYFTWTDFRNPGSQGDIYCKVIEWEDALSVPPEAPLLPLQFAVHPPFPNPFNPVTRIRFDLPRKAQVTLEVFDINGRMVGQASVLASTGGRQGRLPHQEWYSAGSHEITFDGSALASGIYIYRLTAGEWTESGKMVLLK